LGLVTLGCYAGVAFIPTIPKITYLTGWGNVRNLFAGESNRADHEDDEACRQPVLRRPRSPRPLCFCSSFDPRWTPSSL